MDPDDDFTRSSATVWLIAGAVTLLVTIGFVIAPASRIVSADTQPPRMAQSSIASEPHATGDTATPAQSDDLPEPDPSPNAIGLGLP